jgi:Ca2+-binding RTX toxin-like protein
MSMARCAPPLLTLRGGRYASVLVRGPRRSTSQGRTSKVGIHDDLRGFLRQVRSLRPQRFAEGSSHVPTRRNHRTATRLDDLDEVRSDLGDQRNDCKGEGNDLLVASAGDDVLNGRPGADVLDGGPGANVLIQ